MLNTESLKETVLVELFGGKIKSLDMPRNTQRAKTAIAKLGVNLADAMLVSEMPVGHKQFPEIARELDRSNIELLVLDEPTAVLTESEAAILLKAIKTLAREGLAIILISHRLQEIIDVADHVLVLRDGGVVREVAARDTSIAQIAEWMVGRELQATKSDVRSVNNSGSSLDPVLRVEHLWGDMPGETVRDASFDVLPGEILGIGGLAGQGKLGIPNGIMGLQVAGGRVLCPLAGIFVKFDAKLQERSL